LARDFGGAHIKPDTVVLNMTNEKKSVENRAYMSLCIACESFMLRVAAGLHAWLEQQEGLAGAAQADVCNILHGVLLVDLVQHDSVGCMSTAARAYFCSLSRAPKTPVMTSGYLSNITVSDRSAELAPGVLKEVY
jgi:hypothetical protein